MNASPPSSKHAERASSTFRALQHAYYDPRNALYRKPPRLPWRPVELLWPFTTAWSSTCSLAGLAPSASASAADGATDPAALLPSRIPAVLRYVPRRDRRPAATGPLGLGSTVYRPLWTPIARRCWRAGTAFHDDNEWAALALLHQHRLTGERRCLELAERIFAFVVGGWSKEPDWRHPGGIRWADARWSIGRNTCSNGPGAEVGAELFLLAGDHTHLAWAARIYDWTRGALQRDDGLYADQIRPDGQIEPAIWSYNQGSMIGAGVLLHQATAEQTYLDDSERTASASLEHYADLDNLLGEPAIFVAVYLRNLLLLDSVRPDPRYRELAESYADAMWERRRDGASGLFLPISSGVNGTAPLVAVESMLAGSPPLP